MVSKRKKVASILLSAVVLITNFPGFSLVAGATSASRQPQVQKIAVIGGTGIDNATKVQLTSDGGYIEVGETNSEDGDFSGLNKGELDGFVAKYDSQGNRQWLKDLGGSGNDLFDSVVQTSDGGYAIAGMSGSNDGDYAGLIKESGPIDEYGEYAGDAILVKLDDSGNKQWVRDIGGTYGDEFLSLEKSADGGIIASGLFESNDGDFAGLHKSGGSYTINCDAFLAKFDSSGNMQWLKGIGGTGQDMFNSVAQTADGGFIAVGSSDSNDNDFNGLQKGGMKYGIYLLDAVAVKVDASGNRQWVRNFGGSFSDSFQDIRQTSDGGYIVVGDTDSDDGDFSGLFKGTRSTYYSDDAVIMKLDGNGGKQWAELLGGNSNASGACFNSVEETSDGSYIASGQSDCTDGDFTGLNKGQLDGILVRFGNSGDLQWIKEVGGSGTDSFENALQTSDGGFIVAGETESPDGDFQSAGLHNPGDGSYILNDAVMVKLDPTKLPSLTTVDTPADNSYIGAGSSGITVSGWALSDSGVGKVTVSLDDGAPVDATINQSRTDVKAAYPDYPNADTSGYSCTLPVSMDALSAGNHTITVRTTDSNDENITKSTSVTVVKAAQNICIDSPSYNGEYSKDFSISGWALNATGIKSVDISVDGGAAKPATTGLYRADVGFALNQHGQYLNADKSGYSLNVTAKTLAAGKHTAKVTVMGVDNEKTESTVEFCIVKPGILNSSMCIDTPDDNSFIKAGSNGITVSGWALSNSGVGQVSVSLDGETPVDATTGESRPDVALTYPKYTNADKSGFSCTLPIEMAQLSDGAHVITVKTVDSDDQTITQTSTVTVKKAGPLITLDSPQNNSAANGDVTVSGWTLNATGIKQNQVDVYVDGAKVQTVSVDGNRPDVENVVNGEKEYLNGDTSGFGCTIPASSLEPGSHVIMVIAKGNDNDAATATSALTVIKAAKPMCIDTPSDSGFIQAGTTGITVKGWAIGASSVSVTLDGNNPVGATAGQSRPDVGNAFKDYSDAGTSGFTCSLPIDMNSLSVGNHLITVKAVGKDGSVSVSKITVKKAAPVITLDTPQNSSTANGEVTVSGWALNATGEQQADVYVDGAKVKTISVNGSRPDVDNVINGEKEYLNGDTSGFSYTIPAGSLEPGSHAVMVIARGIDDGMAIATATVNVQNEAKPMCIDTPSDNRFIQAGTTGITVRGWAIGASSVSVTLDGDNPVSATAGQSRPDVGNAYKDYTDAGTSGFSCSLPVNMNSLSTGDHLITVKAVGEDGSVSVSKITVKKAAPAIIIDTPQNDSTWSGDVTVSGWTLNATGVKQNQADVYIDGAKVQTVSVNGSRPDVENVVNGGQEYLNGDTSGFSCTIPASSIESGRHIITVIATGNDNTTAAATASITIQKSEKPMCIDTPMDQSALQDGTAAITVNGWAIDASSVNVNIDGEAPVSATINQSRPDVGNAYKDYANAGTSGFSCSLPVNSLSAGNHLITVKVTGNNGSVTTRTITIKTNKSNLE